MLPWCACGRGTDRQTAGMQDLTLHDTLSGNSDSMDSNARHNHAIPNSKIEWAQTVMRRLAPMPGERILDLGCGTASVTAMLPSTMGTGHVVGVDVSEAMLREAVARTASVPRLPVCTMRPSCPPT